MLKELALLGRTRRALFLLLLLLLGLLLLLLLEDAMLTWLWGGENYSPPCNSFFLLKTLIKNVIAIEILN